MTKRWIFLGAGAVGYGAVVTYADPMLLFILVYAGLLFLVAPCAAVALVILVFAIASKRWLRPPILLLIGVFTVAALLALSLPINGYIQQRAVVAAKAFPDRVAPMLEEYRRQHGAYPASLDQLPSHPHVPRLLRTSYGYRAQGQTYTFTFPQPGGMIDVWDDSSETHTWHLST